MTRPGDLIELGPHRLVCGDCTDPEVVALALDGAEPRLMVTDPPYGVSYDPAWRNGKQPTTPEGHAMERANVERRIERVLGDHVTDWRAAWRLFPGAVVYQWAPLGADFVRHVEALAAERFTMRSTIIWAKQTFPVGRGHYHVQHEPCIYAVRKGATAGWIGDRKQTTLWTGILAPIGFHAVRRATDHPTEKPVACMERAIRNHEGDVYDPFVGSGSTLIAADRQGRTCYAVEIEPAHCDAIRERWARHTEQGTLALARAV